MYQDKARVVDEICVTAAQDGGMFVRLVDEDHEGQVYRITKGGVKKLMKKLKDIKHEVLVQRKDKIQ